MSSTANDGAPPHGAGGYGDEGAGARARVVVVGAGVIGLTTAIALLESGLPVHVWADSAPEDTTSAVAGATWFPYRALPADRVLRWTGRSKTYFDALAGDPEETGVRIRASLQLWREEPGAEDPWWAGAVPDLRRCAATELPDGFRSGYAFTQPVITMPVYLRYLVRRFRAAGGEITSRTVGSLDEAAGLADLVVNCTGMAARSLTQDASLVPVRGQWVRVANPGTARVTADFGHPEGETYIIPHEDSVILGGTAEEGAWNTTPSMDTAAALVSRCAKLDPRLRRMPVLEHRAALRPVRLSGVRLEHDGGDTGAGALIHNYGHGGSGVTLSWGCAEEVTGIAHRLLGTTAGARPA